MNTIPSTSLRTLLASAIIGTLASIATVSNASEASSPPQVVVKFADLDISTPKGTKTLYRRIHTAAADICLQMYQTDDSYRAHKNACLQKVIGDAVIKVNRPALSAAFASDFGLPAPVVLAAAGSQ
jgi:UrcA family protein